MSFKNWLTSVYVTIVEVYLSIHDAGFWGCTPQTQLWLNDWFCGYYLKIQILKVKQKKLTDF